MLPISFTQTKFLNPLNIIKAFIWFSLRGFQLKNKKKYKKIVISNFDKSEFLDLVIPNDIEVVSKVEDDSLILLSKFKPYLFLNIYFL